MAFKLNRSSKEPMSEINVTPFVDVMLVLLIIFMVTAPLLTVGVQVGVTFISLIGSFDERFNLKAILDNR